MLMKVVIDTNVLVSALSSRSIFHWLVLDLFTDVHTKEIRSYNMSRIKGKDTKPEMLVRQFLHANGFRYKLYDKGLPCKPDIVLPETKQ